MENNTVSLLPFRRIRTDDVVKKPLAINTGKKQRIVTGLEKEIVELAIHLEIMWIILWQGINPLRWFRLHKAMDPHRRKILKGRRVKKIVRVGSKYHWGVYIPAWPSRAFHDFVTAELNRVYPLKTKTNRFTNIYLAITNKCPLQCEHCYEWDMLNKKEKQSLTDLKAIVQKFEAKGVTQIHISGGEPLVRMNDLIELLKSSDKKSEWWVLTSGFNLTAENAFKLKEAGLKGVMISLDHFEPEMHDKFRGYPDSYKNAIKAIKNSIESGLVAVMNICVTRAFVTEANLMAYIELARSMGVPFVQILEPRAVGQYKGKDVDLTPEQTILTEAFYLKMNYDDRYADYPSVCYHGYHQRRMGCHAAGKRSLYVDTVGNIHACPFCQSSTGNALCDDLDKSIEALQRNGCHKFEFEDPVL